MTRHTLTSILFGSIILFSCKKESTKWDTEWAAPVAHGHLTINDMLPVENVETNSDGYLSLVIHRPVFEFSLDTLITLPDTALSHRTAIEIPSFDVSPSFILPNTYDQTYDLGEIQLKRVIIESGTAITSAESEWPGKTRVFVNFPEAVNADGGIFQHTFRLDAGSVASPTFSDTTLNMAFYDMDLTGEDGLQYNAVKINVIVFSNEETETFTVTNLDSVALSFAFKDMVPRYAKGYFGQYYFSDTMGVALPALRKVVSGSINLDSINLKMTVKNGFNLIAQSTITKITGINTNTSNLVDLDFPDKNNTLNIDPASGGLYDFAPSEYPIVIDNSNSNVLDFLENLSDSIIVGYDLEINPFGNITAGSDEFFPGSKMELFLDGEFPLSFGANDLTIVDTINLNWVETDNFTPGEGAVLLDYTNGFPIGATGKFYLLDENNTIIDSITTTTPIQSGAYVSDTFATTPHVGTAVYNLTASQVANLEITKKLILNVSFNTDGTENIKIDPDTFFDFNLRSNLQISVSL